MSLILQYKDYHATTLRHDVNQGEVKFFLGCVMRLVPRLALNPAVAKLHAAHLSFGVTAAED